MPVISSLYDAEASPLMVRYQSGDPNLSELVCRDAGWIADTLLDRGAILFRSFDILDAPSFDQFATALNLPRLDYIYRSTPRTAIEKRIFTATEYPADQEIPLHNELAYQSAWPLKLAFCCITAAETGGETPLADLRQVTRAIPGALLDKFATYGVKYIRNYRPYIDLPWQQVFQTSDKAALAAFCRSNRIQYEWLAQDSLRTEQICQGVAEHPQTHEVYLFNQAHLFHRSSIDPETASILEESFGIAGLPRNSAFGDGTDFTAEELAAVRAAFSVHAMVFNWTAGDVLLVDNMRMAHGRLPYRGARKHLAVLLEPYAPAIEAYGDRIGPREVTP